MAEDAAPAPCAASVTVWRELGVGSVRLRELLLQGRQTLPQVRQGALLGVAGKR
jgi:hypothetical protein